MSTTLTNENGNNPLTTHPNVIEALKDEEQLVDAEVHNPGDEEIALRIIHILKIYPKVSPSMLQVAMGTSLSPASWKPVLERLITEGAVQREAVGATTPSGRYQTYRVISLNPNFGAAPHQSADGK